MDVSHFRKSWTQRFIETCAVLLLMWPTMGLASLALSVYLLWVSMPTRIAMLVYIGWIAMDDAPRNGRGRPFPWARRWRLWSYFGSYFPVSFEAAARLSPDKTYIFGFHPHGYFSLAAFATFGNDVLGFPDLFPGLHLTVVTLPVQFYIPFYREFILAINASVANKRTIAARLRRGPGSVVGIVLGGAREAIETCPGTNDLILNRRKGFVKIALREGASLVPVFAFGQNDIFKPLIDPVRAPRAAAIVHKFEKLLLATIGFVMPLFHGVGYSILPYRRPVHVVVGAPIELPRMEDPDQAAIDTWHATYVAALRDLYDAHKNEYLRNRTRSLQVIG